MGYSSCVHAEPARSTAARPQSNPARSAGAGSTERPRRRASGRPDRARWPYRMQDLSERTGVPRQVVHFYIREGLLPEGHKTGRNMAYYGEEHLARIRLVRRLQEERFLPLRAIKALIDGGDAEFVPSQQRLLAEVKRELGAELRPSEDGGSTGVAALLRRTGVERRDLEALARLGLVRLRGGRRSASRVASEDAWVVELWGEV